MSARYSPFNWSEANALLSRHRGAASSVNPFRKQTEVLRCVDSSVDDDPAAAPAFYCQVAVSGSIPWARALASTIRRSQLARPARIPS